MDPAQYLRDNPDVAAAGMDPTQHYQQYGQYEGRNPGGELGLHNTNQQTKQALAEMGLSQANRASDLLSTPFNPNSGAPAGGDASGIMGVGQARTSFDPGGQIQTSFGDAGDITRSYGAGDFSADRQRVEDSLMARMNPQLASERGNIEQRLADQGIRYGSHGLHLGDGRLQSADQ